MSTDTAPDDPTENDIVLESVGKRFQTYIGARDERPTHEEVAEVVHRAIVHDKRSIGWVADQLGIHRTQLNRDYGWAWLHGRDDAPSWWDTNRTKPNREEGDVA